MILSRPLQAVVVDASAMIEVLGGDERWTAQMEQWHGTGALLLAPSHFPIEMANALMYGVRLPAADVISRLQQLFAAGIDLVDRGLVGLYDAVELAGRHRLTIYDAAYLSLVLDVDGELATNDEALIRAAKAEDVTVVV
ncbi:MAG: type II toxin-antitoxin system VapC family toxin [Chloroflexota bacterium]